MCGSAGEDLATSDWGSIISEVMSEPGLKNDHLPARRTSRRKINEWEAMFRDAGCRGCQASEQRSSRRSRDGHPIVMSLL